MGELGSENLDGKLEDCISVFGNSKWETNKCGMGTDGNIQIWEKMKLDRSYVEVTQMKL